MLKPEITVVLKDLLMREKRRLLGKPEAPPSELNPEEYLMILDRVGEELEQEMADWRRSVGLPEKESGE